MRPLAAMRPGDPTTVPVERPLRLAALASGTLNSPGHPRDPVLQMKRVSPRMEETSDPALRDACCGIGHVQAHAALPAGSLPYQRSLREG